MTNTDVNVDGLKSVIHDGALTYAEGASRITKVWKNKTMLWSELLNMLAHPVETFETSEEYKRFPKSKQDEIKDVGGIVGGWLKEGKRKKGYVQQRSMIALDADTPAQGFWEKIQFLLGYAIALSSTHSHTREDPRYRLYIPLKRPVTAEEYEPLARKIAEMLGMDNFDDTTYQAERLMHKPSHSKGAEYVFHYRDLPWIDPEEILAKYEDWRDVSYWPESSRGNSIRETQAKKLGEPTEKNGVIGAFCRSYDIVSAIETFLPDVYGATGKDDRWTYLSGSTSGGLVVYDGKFAYSHHGTDPVGDQLVNAFDLVRIHKFGDLDNNIKPDTPINRYPSYKAMSEMAQEDKAVKKELIKQQLEQAREDFGIADLANDEWLSKLRINSRGKLERSIYNGYLFLENHPDLSGGLAYNSFSQQVVKTRSFTWSTGNSNEWIDADTTLLRAYLDESNNFQLDENTLRASVLQSATQRRFHPVKEYIEKETWDGVTRVPAVFIDYLGVEDSAYTRDVTKKWFTGAVARIYRPGVKFEIVPILSGAQGIGKSTLIKKLAPEFFSDSLKGLGESKDDLQFLIGSWLLEISELSAMRRTEVEKTKQFISATDDRFRSPYGHGVQTYQRTCVFMGTSNDDQYLKDKTGNRRFYPMPCDAQRQKFSVHDGSIEKIVGQLWAEAKYYFDNGEPLYLSGDTEKTAQEMQKGAMVEDVVEEGVREFLDIKIPKNWYERPLHERVNYIQAKIHGNEEFFGEKDTELVYREVVTVKEIYLELFNRSVSTSLDARSCPELRKLSAIMTSIENWKNQTIRLPDNKRKTVKGYKRIK